MILIDKDTKVLVQGITGREASFHTRKCIEYGTRVVAGVTPGKGGTTWEDEVPVFNSVEQAREETGANTSLIFVPAAFAFDAIIEAADAGMGLIACITEHILALDELKLHNYRRDKNTTVIGPNCPGVISPPAKCKIGIIISSPSTSVTR